MSAPTHATAFDLYEQQDYAAAFAQFLQMATEGDVECQSIVGKMYLAGEGVAVDVSAARTWFEKAARNNHVDAYLGLAAISDRTGDRERTFKYTKAAADQGHLIALYRVGVMYDRGYGCERDLRKAIFYYQRASDNGHLLARARVGCLALEKEVPQIGPLRGLAMFLSSLPRRIVLALIQRNHPHVLP